MQEREAREAREAAEGADITATERLISLQECNGECACEHCLYALDLAPRPTTRYDPDDVHGDHADNDARPNDARPVRTPLLYSWPPLSGSSCVPRNPLAELDEDDERLMRADTPVVFSA